MPEKQKAPALRGHVRRVVTGTGESSWEATVRLAACSEVAVSISRSVAICQVLGQVLPAAVPLIRQAA